MNDETEWFAIKDGGGIHVDTLALSRDEAWKNYAEDIDNDLADEIAAGTTRCVRVEVTEIEDS